MAAMSHRARLRPMTASVTPGLYAVGEKRYTPGKLCGGCPRTKSDAPRHVPISLPEKHTTRSVTKPMEVLL